MSSALAFLSLAANQMFNAQLAMLNVQIISLYNAN